MKELCGICDKLCGKFGPYKKKTINLFNCKNWLHNLDANAHFSVFNEKIMNFISNSNLNKLVISGDRDHPWMNCGHKWLS